MSKKRRNNNKKIKSIISGIILAVVAFILIIPSAGLKTVRDELAENLGLTQFLRSIDDDGKFDESKAKTFDSNYNSKHGTVKNSGQKEYTTSKVDPHKPKQAAEIIDLGKSDFTEDELSNDNGFIEYGELDTSKNDLILEWAKKYNLKNPVMGRATAMNAVVTPDMLRTGTSANNGIYPSGWISGASPIKQARGHLLANVLGGSGDDPRNLATIYQNPVNTPYMTDYELDIRDAVSNGDIVRYRVEPVFDDSEPLFVKEIIMTGKSLTPNGTIDFKVKIPNEK